MSETITVVIDPPTSSVVLGESVDLQVTVANGAAEATPNLVLHIDITSLDESGSVDPEDWTPTLSQSIGEIAAGETVVVDWTLQPISAGTFTSYAVALSPGVDTIAASNVFEVRVIDQRSLNPNGVLPVAVGMPSIIAVLLAMQIRSARRSRQPKRADSSGARS